jgi:hypothetical protein
MIRVLTILAATAALAVAVQPASAMNDLKIVKRLDSSSKVLFADPPPRPKSKPRLAESGGHATAHHPQGEDSRGLWAL